MTVGREFRDDSYNFMEIQWIKILAQNLLGDDFV